MSCGSRIGVVATPIERAHSIVRDLGLDELHDMDAVNVWPISARSRNAGRGLRLDLLLIDQSALPLSGERWGNLAPCLAPHGNAYIVRPLSPADIAP